MRILSTKQAPFAEGRGRYLLIPRRPAAAVPGDHSDRRDCVEVAPAAQEQREVQQLARLKAQYALLREEHELLKKAIRFCSERGPGSSPSSSRSRTGSE